MNVIPLKMKILAWLFIFITILINIQSCQKDGLQHTVNTIQMLPKLSDYNIFQGNFRDLKPSDSFHLYEISTQLFSDYAEKQRLIKLPAGTTMHATNDGLPDFPDGTMLVKTFYYFNDKRDTLRGKKIVETRLLIKAGSQWNAATYLWNEEQTDATLLTTGINEMVNWIDDNGSPKIISFHVPNINECATCHHSNEEVMPIGPKIRNLNFSVQRNNETINQLTYFQNTCILNPVNPASFSSLPDWKNTMLTVDQRARAYLDVNCAHCHNPSGFAANTGIVFSYETPFDQTKIGKVKGAIHDQMSSGEMPKLGTTTIDEKGLALITEYIKSL